jgi:hypothetical protein
MIDGSDKCENGEDHRQSKLKSNSWWYTLLLTIS